MDADDNMYIWQIDDSLTVHNLKGVLTVRV